jgi:ATP synthase protein I
MPSHLVDSGDLPQDSATASAHRSPVTRTALPTGSASGTATTIESVSGAARNARQFYQSLSASSVGLELGLSVVLGILFGRWLDGKLGTAPWMMLAFLLLGLVAGFRSLMRAVQRADRAAEAEARHRG